MSTNSKNHLILVDYIKHNQDRFYRVALSYSKSQEDALDIVQESIYKALKKSKQIKSECYISTWFYRILINTSISHIKRNVHHIPYDDYEKHYHGPDHNLTNGIEDTLASNIDLYDALSYLNPIDKSIVILRFFEDKTFKDISEILGLNINTIKTKLYAILKRLRSKLDLEVVINEHE